MKNKPKLNQGWKYLSLVVASLVVTLQSFAYDFLVDGIYYKITNSSTREVSVTLKYYDSGGRYESATIISDYKGNVVIPSTVTYNGIVYSVTGIGDNAFDDSDVTSVTIPNTVKSIGNSAFAYCILLTNIQIPSSVTSLGGSVFASSGLSNISIPQSITAIPGGAFAFCTRLQTVSIPNSVSIIGDGAFRGCTLLTEIQIPSSVTSFGSSVFTDSGLTNPVTCGNRLLYCPPNYEGEYHIPMGITELGGGGFSGCTKLTKVIIPHGVTSIPAYTFQNCTSLESVSVPVNVNAVGGRAFSGCISLKECILPNTVTDISDAFHGCSSLESFIVPACVSRIANYAFENCKSLKSIVFPKNVTNIRLWAFGSTPYQGIEVYNFAPMLQGQSEGPTGLYPSKIHVPEGWEEAAAWSPISGTLVYDLQSVTSLSINKTTLSIKEGTTATLRCTIAPTNASVKTLHWSSNNTDVAIVDNSGNVTALKSGTAVIKASSLDGSNLSVSCEVTVFNNNKALVDGEPYANTRRTTYDAVTFTKTFASGAVNKWNALYVPISIDVAANAEDFDIAEIYAFCSTVDTNGDGTVDANDERFLFVRPLTSGRTYPNTPYLIRPREAKTYVINSADNILYEKRDGKVEFSTTKDKFVVTGLNEGFTVVAGDNNYFVTGTGALSYRTTGSTMVKPNRWVMHREDREYSDIPDYVEDSNHLDNEDNGESGAKEYRILVIGEEISETDAIMAVKKANGVFTSGIYTIDGRRMSDSKSLPNGVYVKNGKKYLK